MLHTPATTLYCTCACTCPCVCKRAAQYCRHPTVRVRTCSTPAQHTTPASQLPCFSGQDAAAAMGESAPQLGHSILCQKQCACRNCPETADAAAALARACVLGTPDRAEARAAAVAAAMGLLGLLGLDARTRFVVFTSRLSRTAKASSYQRLIMPCPVNWQQEDRAGPALLRHGPPGSDGSGQDIICDLCVRPVSHSQGQRTVCSCPRTVSGVRFMHGSA